MAIKRERGEPWRNSRKFGIETASTGRKRREEREERILQPSANENYMRNPFPPWKPGFYRLVRNTGCLDKSNLSCSICICIRRQRALRRLLRVGTHRRSRVPFQIRVFANTPRTHAHTPSLSLLLIPPRLSPYLFISASALMSSHPRREKSPSSLLLLVRTNFPSVPLNFVPRLSRLAIEVFCDSRLFEEITPCLPSFPPCDVRIVKGDRIVVRCAVFESRNESMFFGGGGFRSLFVANDARYMKHDIYIYMYGYIGGPRGRGT